MPLHVIFMPPFPCHLTQLVWMYLAPDGTTCISGDIIIWMPWPAPYVRFSLKSCCSHKKRLHPLFYPFTRKGTQQWYVANELKSHGPTPTCRHRSRFSGWWRLVSSSCRESDQADADPNIESLDPFCLHYNTNNLFICLSDQAGESSLPPLQHKQFVNLFN